MDFRNYIGSSIIFSIPIYFRSIEEHKKYFDEKKDRYFRQQEALFHKIGAKIDAKERMRLDITFNKFYYHVWNYTEIIGYIEFRKKENCIYAFIVLPVAKRFAPLMNKKKYKLSDEFPTYKVEIDDLVKEEIVEKIYSIIQIIQKHSRRFRRYYIDTSELENYIHIIDYRNFIGSNND